MDIPALLPQHTDARRTPFWVLQASRAWSEEATLQEDDPWALMTLGVDGDQRAAIQEAMRGSMAVDPVAQYLIGHTNGIAYQHLVGQLAHYPIPALPSLLQQPERRNVPSTLLDIGCSWGRWSLAATRQGWNVVGLDPSLGAILAARRIADQLGLAANFICGDAAHLPIASNSIDAVFSYSVLQHFDPVSLAMTLSEIRRVLVPGGYCHIQMANATGARAQYHLAKRSWRKARDFEVRYWTIRQLRDLFEQHIGPAITDVDSYFGLGLRASDIQFLKPNAAAATRLSVGLRKISRHLPPAKVFADSLWIHATKME